VRGVVITGAGVVTPLAQSPRALHQALCDGTDAMTTLPAFAGAGVACELGAAVDVAPMWRELGHPAGAGVDRLGQLTIVAARRALSSAVVADATAMGMVLGTMFSGAHTIGEFDRRAQTAGPQFASPLDFANTVLNAAAGQAAIRLTLRGINVTIAAGHASGLQALGYAADLIAAGRDEALLAGGAEELSLESYLGFGHAGMMCGTNGRPGHVPIPFDARRTGFALGEGAAFLVLERDDAAERRRATVQARLAGHAAATDPDALEGGYCTRATIAAVVREALGRAGVTPQDVDTISAAANGSYEADREEAAALHDVFGRRRVPPAVTAIKSVLGETLGAAGPLQVAAMLEAMHDGRLPGIRGLSEADCADGVDIRAAARPLSIRTALVTAVSPEGSCGALVLQHPEDVK